MNEASFQLYRTWAAFLSFALAVALQGLLPATEGPVAPKTWRVNLPMAAVNSLATTVLCSACACTVSRYVSARGLGLLNIWSFPRIPAIAVSIAVLDFAAFLWHRANHRLPLLWRFHAVHHSDSTYDASTAVRFHPGEIFLSLAVKVGVVAVLGLPVVGILTFEVIFAFFNFFVHGSIRLPGRLNDLLAVVFITPALHRQHHAADRTQLNTNFGTIFSLWDRLFRTLALVARGELRSVGLPGGAPWARSLAGLLSQPFR